MKIGIFYFSLSAGKDRQPIFLNKVGELPVRKGWIRAVTIDVEDERTALSLAQPMDDEALMNTHSLEVTASGS